MKNETMRKETEEAAIRLHELITSGITPPPVYSAKCKKCSLVGLCLPQVNKKVRNYLLKVIEEE